MKYTYIYADVYMHIHIHIHIHVHISNYYYYDYGKRAAKQLLFQLAAFVVMPGATQNRGLNLNHCPGVHPFRSERPKNADLGLVVSRLCGARTSTTVQSKTVRELKVVIARTPRTHTT